MFQPHPPACQSHEVIFLQWTWIVILNTLLTTVATEESDLVFQPQFSFQNKKKKKKKKALKQYLNLGARLS